MASPLYAHFLRQCAADVEAEGPVWRILEDHVAPGRGGALALRLMAAVHRLVLSGGAPELHARYPSVGGDGDAEAAWPAFRRLAESARSTLAALVALPCQTNEVGRSAALMWGFLDVAAFTSRPLRLFEVGASAGLNLRCDRFRFGGGGAFFGPPDSPVDLVGLWRDAPPRTDVTIEVVERRGCDPRPLDPSSEADSLSLRASIWADQKERFARLSGALRVAAEVPAPVDAASAADWLPSVLASSLGGAVRVVYHSVVDEYLDEPTRRRVHTILDQTGRRATAESPFAWVRLEPHTSIREHGLWVTTWPGGATRLLALCGAHGTDVRRA
jgi:hypothetical protein